MSRREEGSFLAAHRVRCDRAFGRVPARYATVMVYRVGAEGAQPVSGGGQAVVPAIVFLLFTLAGGCEAPNDQGEQRHPLTPRPVRELAVTPIFESENGPRVGELVEMEIEGSHAPVSLYRVRNSSRQWVGTIDSQGRFFRRSLFSSREEALGMYPMEVGLALLLELPGERVALGTRVRVKSGAEEAAVSGRTRFR